ETPASLILKPFSLAFSLSMPSQTLLIVPAASRDFRPIDKHCMRTPGEPRTAPFSISPKKSSPKWLSSSARSSSGKEMNSPFPSAGNAISPRHFVAMHHRRSDSFVGIGAGLLQVDRHLHDALNRERTGDAENECREVVSLRLAGRDELE